MPASSFRSVVLSSSATTSVEWNHCGFDNDRGTEAPCGAVLPTFKALLECREAGKDVF